MNVVKVTLDHNVIIDLANRTSNVDRIRKMLAAEDCQAYVVEIGASEMRQRGIRPERYDLFEQLLDDAGIRSLPRLTPMMIWDVTFWDHWVWSDDLMLNRAADIEQVLFGDASRIDLQVGINDSKKFKKWLNRTCDVHTMWCHLHYANDVFVTSDRNFCKATKLTQLLEMGAGRICSPEEL